MQRGEPFRWIRRTSVRTKVFGLVLVALIPFILVEGYYIKRRFDTQAAAQLQASLELSMAISSGFQAQLESLWLAEHTIGTALINDPAHTDQYLQIPLNDYPAIREIYWVSPEGIIAAASNPAVQSQSIADWGCFQRLLGGEERTISDLIQHPGSGALSVNVARAIRVDGVLQGVVLVSLDPPRLGELLQVDRLGQSTFGLVDRQGLVVFRNTDPDLPLERRRVNPAHGSPALAALQGRTEVSRAFHASQDSTVRMGAGVPLPAIGWAAFASAPVDEVLGPARLDARRQMTVLFLIVCSSLLLAFSLSSQLLRPIYALRRAAKALTRGDLAARVAVDGADEIAETARDFNTMAAALERAHGALLERERLLAEKRETFELIAQGRPLIEILAHIARFVERRVSGSPCAILLMDGQRRALRYKAAPSLPAPYFQAMLDAETASDDAWSRYQAYMVEYGIYPTCSVPIMSDAGEVLGKVTLCAAAQRLPDEAELQTAQLAANMASIAIERDRLEQGRVQKLHALISQMAEGVIAVDATGRLLFTNPAAGRLLRLAEPIQDKTGLPPLLVEALDMALMPDTAPPQRLSVRTGEVELEVLVSPVCSELGRHGAIAVMQDVTHYQRFRRLQEAFVANASHELRGPLASLSAVVEALVDGLIPPERQLDYLRKVKSEMERLRRLSHEIIDLSRLDAGTAALARDEVDLAAIFAELAATLGPRFAAAGVTLGVDPTNLHVSGDYDRILQVLLNLLENGLRFTPAGGLVRLSARAEGPSARIVVTDTGIGIPEAHLPYIWERFYQVDQARTLTPDRGTGLGLALVRQLVERMGGQVAVQSAPGAGSAFSFTLTLSAAVPAPQ